MNKLYNQCSKLNLISDLAGQRTYCSPQTCIYLTSINLPPSKMMILAELYAECIQLCVRGKIIGIAQCGRSGSQLVEGKMEL